MASPREKLHGNSAASFSPPQGEDSRPRIMLRLLFQDARFENIAQWRQAMAEKIFFLAAFFLPVGLLISLPAYVAHKRYGIIAFDLALFVWAIATLTLRRGPLRPAARGALVVALLASLYFHVTMGPFGARPLWLAVVVSVAATFYGLPGVALGIALNVAVLALGYLLMPRSSLAWAPVFAAPVTAWIQHIANTSLITAILGVAIAAMLKGLERQVEEIRRSEARYRFVAENASDIIWTADADLRLTYVSPSISQFSDETPVDFLTKTILDWVRPESRDEISAHYERRFQLAAEGDTSAYEPFIYEAEHLRRGGSILLTQNHVRLVPGESGGPIQIVGASHDITAQRAAEKAQASLQEQLHESQKMEAMGRLAGGIAHDFNNLLCAIKGNAELLLEDLEPMPELRESVEMIDEASDRATDLTRQLLAFSRKQVIAPRVVDLGATAQGLQRMLQRVIGEDIVLSIDIDVNEGYARLDPGQIEQVVLNLVINARDAMPRGGTISIKVRGEKLEDDAVAAKGGGARHGG